MKLTNEERIVLYLILIMKGQFSEITDSKDCSHQKLEFLSYLTESDYEGMLIKGIKIIKQVLP